MLLAEPFRWSKANREKMATTMFETFSAPKVFFAQADVLALYASGKTTGLVLDVGDYGTSATPVFDGYSLPHATTASDIGGARLTAYMHKMIGEVGIHTHLDVARNIKEKMGWVSLDFDKDKETAERNVERNMPYMLPDGTALTIGNQAFRVGEALFQPAHVGIETYGLHTLAFASIMKCARAFTRTSWCAAAAADSRALPIVS